MDIIFSDEPEVCINGLVQKGLPKEERYKIMMEQVSEVNLKSTRQKVEELINNSHINMNDFKQEIENLIDNVIFVNNGTMKTGTFSPFETIIKKNTILYRVVSNELFKWAPPTYLTRVGRMNKIEESCFYLSFNPNTCLSEIGISKSDVVHYMSIYRVKQDIQTTLSYGSQFQSKVYSERDKIIGKGLVTFFNMILGWRSSDNLYTNEKNYYMSNYLKITLLQSKKINLGIIYPSVKMNSKSKSISSRDGTSLNGFDNVAFYMTNQELYFERIKCQKINNFFDQKNLYLS
ncbi:hypothetical protein [Companilactobacillus jidongensis]|uniref:hypothetical protein n=1 Tax=Companilactobacillus jidongensis TaxID=2486006 RepID=UPI000F79E379|nr:hypothetical protein [Companilactobacillus jidongensis]